LGLVSYFEFRNSGLSGLGFSGTELSKKLGVLQAAVSISVRHGWKDHQIRAVRACPQNKEPENLLGWILAIIYGWILSCDQIFEDRSVDTK